MKHFISRWWKLIPVLVLIVPLAILAMPRVLHFISNMHSNSLPPIERWFTNLSSRPALTTNRQVCPSAPFMLPSDGFIGLLWNDPASPYTITATHAGIDIFGNGTPGTVPVYAAYDGYLTRLESWVSSVIIRHDDPLQPGRTIWTYYTHMASRDGGESFVVDEFPPGTGNVFVRQGTLLGYQGEYAGVGRAPIGMHLHFSIVLSDENGVFTNQDFISNTLDPSAYLGMQLNIAAMPERPIQCGL